MTETERRAMIESYSEAHDKLAAALAEIPREIWTFENLKSEI